MSRPVGRPKKNRVKIGLSIYKETNDQLTELANKLGTTKSAVVEEAISTLYEIEQSKAIMLEVYDELVGKNTDAHHKEELTKFWEEEKEVCEARIDKILETGADQYFDLDEIGENR